jgi:hypothetical protein
VSKSGTHVAGVVLVVLGGMVTGGAWSFWRQPHRTPGFTLAAIVFTLAAVVLVVAGALRLV